MKIEKFSLLLLGFLLILISCKKDDDGGIEPIPLRDRADQQIVDNDSIVSYLSSHYYNKSYFQQSGIDFSINDIVISKVMEGQNISSDADSLLINAVETHKVMYAETEYQYYILRLRQGESTGSPTFADTVRLIYEGFLLNDITFTTELIPSDLDLTSLIPGWRKVMPSFNVAQFPPIENGDGTVDYVGGGLGIMFLPSGLAYFNNATGSIPSYAPIAFKFELLQFFENDHDNDGIPSYLEDLPDENGETDGEFTVLADPDLHDDDTDGDRIPDYLDPDDDGDRIPTRNEDLDGDGDYEEHDTNGNNIPNYLDPEDKIY